MTQASTTSTAGAAAVASAAGTPVPAAPVRTSASTRDVRAVRPTPTRVPTVAQVTPRTGLHIRSAAMLLLDENLSRARMREAEKHAEESRQAQRVLVARRSRRRALQAAGRARLTRAL